LRKERRIRPGYTPQEDVSVFKTSRQAESERRALPKGHIPGWVPRAATGEGQKKSAAAKKNAKRREKKKEEKVKENWEDEEEDVERAEGDTVKSEAPGDSNAPDEDWVEGGKVAASEKTESKASGAPSKSDSPEPLSKQDKGARAKTSSTVDGVASKLEELQVD
jgi:partner of Y14 and mago protein